VGGLTPSSASLLCQGLRYLKLLQKQHLCQVVAEITTTLSVPSRGYSPMGALHLHANTDQAHHHSRKAQGNTNRLPPLPHAEMSLQMQRLQEGHDAGDTVTARPQRTGFSPWKPCYKDVVTLNGALSRESDTTIGSDSGAFTENTTLVAHSPPVTEASNSPQP
jgi:hypothetical protein